MAEHQSPVSDEPTIGKLVVDAFDDAGTLLSHMVALAKSELKVSVKAGGIGLAMFALAGFILLLAIIMASISIAYFIVMAGLDPAWAFLIVFGGYLALTLLLALIGFLRIRKVRAPERTIAAAQELPRALRRG